MCGTQHRSYQRLTTMPVDPSPTPWNFNTWGFFCDFCMTFFDLVMDGDVLTFEDNTCSYQHTACGQIARYIGYRRDEASLLA